LCVRRSLGRRGFTLVELMVALSGGLFLSAVVFALSRDTTRFYQREARVAGATFAGLVGFERLKADIRRAGYLSTPNVQSDPHMLAPPGSTAPDTLKSLAGLRIVPDTPNLSTNGAFSANAAAGQTLTPDQIVLSGSYSIADEFAIAEFNGQTAFLQVNSPPMARLGYISASAAAQTALLGNIFAPGRLLRIVDRAGKAQFGTIASVSGGATPSVTLAAAVTARGGNGTGGSINVVNVIRYQIRDLRVENQARWAPLFAASAGAPGEGNRTELVREELDEDGEVIDGTTEIVAEYAVDLGFAVNGQLAPGVPGLVYSVPGDANFTTFYATAMAGDRPQGVRSVRVRLSVRSREADRETNVSGTTGVYRFKLGTNDAWARVRTFQADVALPNQVSVQW
jgi:hypothetical protein